MRAKDDEKKRTIGTYDERKRPSGVHATKMGPEDFQLHVHSDHGTGGHWCAKIFFFSLFIILLGLICLIIMENRGLEDLDRPFSESRYAEILEGWVDDDFDANDNHKGKNQMHDKNKVYQHEDEGFVVESEDETDNEIEDHEEGFVDESEGEIDNEIEDHEEGFVDESEDEIDNEEDNDEGFVDESEDEREDETDNEIEDQDESFVDESEDETDNELEDEIENEIEDHSEENSIENELNTKGNNDLETRNNSDENSETSEETDLPQDNDLERESSNLREEPLGQDLMEEIIVDNLDDNSEENSEISSVENHDDNLSAETDLPQDNHNIERKSSNLKDDPLDHKIMEEIEENDLDELESTNSEENSETSPLMVRIIVGLALVIVAHQVLLKKPGSNEGNVDQEPETIEENEIIDMKRRFTLVTAEEPIPLHEDDMIQHPLIIEGLSATGGSVEAFPDGECLTNPNLSIDDQTKDATSEEEPLDDEEEPLDPDSDEIILNEEKDLDSEEELLSSEEIDIYSDEEINDFESSETSDIDDSDLLKRLDEKYGKLPQHSDTDDIDNDPTWTTIVADDSYADSDLARDQPSQESNYH